MYALVVGGDSKLGRALCDRLLARGHEVVKTTRRNNPDAPVRREETIVDFDMLDPQQLPVEDDGTPYVLYIMAAITGIAPASSHPDAWRVNAEAPVALAMQAKERGWHVVFMSSGAVERAQETASARQKAYADLAVLMMGGCVVRPLPTVPPEKYNEVADLLVDIGVTRRAGLVRWEG